MSVRIAALGWFWGVLVSAIGCASTSGTGRSGPGSGAETSAGPASVIVFVRHAEKASDGSKDPPLTEQGQARARCLVHELDGFSPTALWSTQYVRTRETLAPLSDEISEPVEVLDASAGDAWIAKLGSVPPGSHVVVAAHSNTIPDWVEALGGDPGPLDEEGNIPHDEYDRIIFVVVDAHGRHVATIVHRYC